MIDLHPALKPYRKEIEATLKPVVRITPTPAQTLLWQSKFGGKPYIPLDTMEEVLFHSPLTGPFFPYPRIERTGKELYMLAQINFEEMPTLEGFPRIGIMQVFVDDNIGNMNDYYVLYYPTVYKDTSLLWTDFSYLKESERWGGIECTLSFEKSIEPISISDFKFEEIYSKELVEILHYNQDVIPSYNTLLNGVCKNGIYNRNKMGGYHYSQNLQDGRQCAWEDEESLLLIQFDGSFNPFCWGDLGPANFFIKKNDLKALDFSDVIYHWDCT
jgi:uncharacterized protein YwqG